MSFQKKFQQRAALAALTAITSITALSASGPAQAASGATYTRIASAAAVAGTAAAAPSGTDLVVNLAGINSYDQQGASLNTVLMLDALPGGTVDLIAWSFSLGTVGLSWLSEAAVRITNSSGEGVAFIPGDGDDLSGVRAYAGGASLLTEGVGFSVLTDGKLYIEFYETWDDAPGAADALYQTGSLTLGAVAAAVPEPAAFGLMGLGLGLLGVAGVSRRRRHHPHHGA